MNDQEYIGFISDQLMQTQGAGGGGGGWESVSQLWAAIAVQAADRPHLQQLILSRLCCPKLLFSMPRVPEPGHRTFVRLTLQPGPFLVACQPEFWVRLPAGIDTQQGPFVDASVSGAAASACFRISASDLFSQGWRFVRLDSHGTDTLEFLWNEELVGDFLWEFRFGFPDLWGHQRLPRFFSGELPMAVSSREPREAVVEGGDGASVSLQDLSRFQKVHIRLGKDARLHEKPEDIARVVNEAYRISGPAQASHGKADTAELSISVDIQPLGRGDFAAAWTGIFTGRDARADFSSNYRVARLEFEKSERSETVPRNLKLHLPVQQVWRLGRLESSGTNGVRRNDLGYRFETPDAAELGLDSGEDSAAACPAGLSERLREFNTFISRVNTEIRVQNDGLFLVNSQTPGGKQPALTYVTVEDLQTRQPIRAVLDQKDQHYRLPDMRSLSVAHRLAVGLGGFYEGAPEKHPPAFWLRLVAIPAWFEDLTGGIPDLWSAEQPFALSAGRFRRVGRWAAGWGIDSLLITPQLRSRSNAAADLILLRQAWLDQNGGVAESPVEDFRIQRPVARLVPVYFEASKRNVVLLQCVHDRLRLRIVHGCEVDGRESENVTDLERYDVAILHDGDEVICRDSQGQHSWRARWHSPCAVTES